ncbi:hypothetical protein NPIL_313711 [Nephila pilipes]|uniref:Uncharacterized protein n=1 Tax=Nephila pilipes TaxID=299642 RepID=A0A8X6TUW3_NEPPI|nr:hypothetical protein NPIL_313711 [Nephila pilipes]
MIDRSCSKKINLPIVLFPDVGLKTKEKKVSNGNNQFSDLDWEKPPILRFQSIMPHHASVGSNSCPGPTERNESMGIGYGRRIVEISMASVPDAIPFQRTWHAFL